MNNYGKLFFGHNFERFGNRSASIKRSTSFKKDEEPRDNEELDEPDKNEIERLNQLTTQNKALNYKRSNFPLVRSTSVLNESLRPKSVLRNVTPVQHTIPSKVKKGSACTIIDCKDLKDASQLDGQKKDNAVVSFDVNANFITEDSLASSNNERTIKKRKKRPTVKGYLFLMNNSFINICINLKCTKVLKS